jgi:hypothetical protein
MREQRCTVCGRGYSRTHPVVERDEYRITFTESVCHLCAVTLARGMEGITEMLKQSHGEKRERVLDRLVTRLEAEGFSTESFPHRRRSA